jgi:hypothetical protein
LRLDERSLFATKWITAQILPKQTSFQKQTVPYYLMTTNHLQFMKSPAMQIMSLKLFKLPDMRQYRNYAEFLGCLALNVLFLAGIGLVYT